jgi:hypothetical protein
MPKNSVPVDMLRLGLALLLSRIIIRQTCLSAAEHHSNVSELETRPYNNAGK